VVIEEWTDDLKKKTMTPLHHHYLHEQRLGLPIMTHTVDDRRMATLTTVLLPQ
jgi:hypothetical protein